MHADIELSVIYNALMLAPFFSICLVSISLDRRVKELTVPKQL